jgi:hypothetical protein
VEFLTREQRNVLWSAVTASGLVGSEFSIMRRPNDLADDVSDSIDDIRTGYIIRHIPSGSTFNIVWHHDSGGILALGQFGDDPWVINHTANFEGMVDQARSWAERIPDWMATPDLWKSMPETVAIPGEFSQDLDNAAFTPAEQEAISARLRGISESIKKVYELTAEQLVEIDKKFEEAEKSSQRMGRKDWGMFFGGIIFSLILTDIITPGVAGHILIMIEHGIGHLFDGPNIGGVLSASQD